MKRYVLCLLACVMLFLTSCGPTHVCEEGLEEFCENGGHGYSELNIASGLFLTVDFINQYSYTDGNFVYRYDGSIWAGDLDRAFAWLSYDDETYPEAKQAGISEDLEPIENAQSVFGFTFCFRKNWRFPRYFTAVGYNDDRKTLVFIGFYCADKTEFEDTDKAETDFAYFLTHYYGDCFDW